MSGARPPAIACLALALTTALVATAWAQRAQTPASQPAPKGPVQSKPGTSSSFRPPLPMPPQLQGLPAPSSQADGGQGDVAYGAYQRGYYLTAFSLATKRVEASSDMRSMTLLGELYANGFGVVQDDTKAASWYRLAMERGDREAIFALAMFRFAGRAGPVNRDEGARLLDAASKRGHVAATYDLGLLYLEGQLFPQDFARAATLFRSAAEAGSPEAQYALATLYKAGRGVQQDAREAAKWLAASARADYTDAQVEYAIALFNGTGVAKDEAAAGPFLRRAARKGSPIAQNRYAQMLASGRGIAADPVEAIKWHLASKAAGATDRNLDDFMARQTPEVRAAGEKAAKPWIEAAKEPRS